MKLNDIYWKHKEFAIHSMYKGQDARLVVLGQSDSGQDVIASYWIDFQRMVHLELIDWMDGIRFQTVIGMK